MVMYAEIYHLFPFEKAKLFQMEINDIIFFIIFIIFIHLTNKIETHEKLIL